MSIKLGLGLGLGRGGPLNVNPGPALIDAATNYWNASDYTSGGSWTDRNASAVITVTGGTKLSSGASYTDSGANSRTALADAIRFVGSGASFASLPFFFNLNPADPDESLAILYRPILPLAFERIYCGAQSSLGAEMYTASDITQVTVKRGSQGGSIGDAGSISDAAVNAIAIVRDGAELGLVTEAGSSATATLASDETGSGTAERIAANFGGSRCEMELVAVLRSAQAYTPADLINIKATVLA